MLCVFNWYTDEYNLDRMDDEDDDDDEDNIESVQVNPNNALSLPSLPRGAAITSDFFRLAIAALGGAQPATSGSNASSQQSFEVRDTALLCAFRWINQ